MFKKIGHVSCQDSSQFPTVLLQIKKQKSPQAVRLAADHNKRVRFFPQPGAVRSAYSSELQKPGNENLYGPDTPEAVADLAKALMKNSGISRLRKDAIRAVEIVISLSRNHNIDDRAFFLDSMYWFAERLGGRENLLSVDLHRDEANDHVHGLIIPLVDGHMIGSQLLGGKGKFRGHKSDFEREVCRQHGVRLLMKDHLSPAEKVRASAAALGAIHQAQDPVLSSPVWDVVKNHIRAHPEPYLWPLGLEPAMFRVPRKLRSTTQIFTSKGKGPAKEERQWPSV